MCGRHCHVINGFIKLGFCTTYNITDKQLMFYAILVFTDCRTLHFFH